MPYPPIEPYAHGLLEVGDDNRIYWETCGNPGGKPALVIHGGPGSGCSAGPRKSFHPERYRTVLFDQRGCGRSLPHASDPATDMSCNTTDHLIADMERLRQHLQIERWLLFGGSWGSTLALAYAERYPERVSEIVLAAVTTTTRAELDWLYRGVGRYFPEAWERLRDGVPEPERAGDLIAAYARLMESTEPPLREQAVLNWCDWEDAVQSLEVKDGRRHFRDRPDRARMAMVRIITHYFSHAAWLEEGVLLREVGRLAGVPAVLLHGRQDLGGPVITAWRLHRAWPGSRLTVFDDVGHTGSQEMNQELISTLDRFSTR